MTENEKLVREMWEHLSAGPDIYGFGITLPTRPTMSFVGYEKSKDAWAAAAEFTRERLEQIRLVEEEIQQLLDDSGDTGWGDSLAEPIYRRILAREQAALAELKRGMKGEQGNG